LRLEFSLELFKKRVIIPVDIGVYVIDIAIVDVLKEFLPPNFFVFRR